MTWNKTALLAAAGSATILLAAVASQYLGGLVPCKMCIWQRWPHGIAIVLGLIVFFFPIRLLTLFGGLAVFFGACIGVYHAGVEQKWWQGPTSCSGSGLSSTEGLLDFSAPLNVVMCDVIQWQLIGITMAGWNAIISLFLAFLWFRAYASSSASQ